MENPSLGLMEKYDTFKDTPVEGIFLGLVFTVVVISIFKTVKNFKSDFLKFYRFKKLNENFEIAEDLIDESELFKEILAQELFLSVSGIDASSTQRRYIEKVIKEKHIPISWLTKAWSEHRVNDNGKISFDIPRFDKFVNFYSVIGGLILGVFGSIFLIMSLIELPNIHPKAILMGVFLMTLSFVAVKQFIPSFYARKIHYRSTLT